jgi:glycerophosphoryl diester phosphodiesterase
MLPKLQRPVIFAHRGASAYAPENTMSSFALAQAQGADAIELDTKLSADGEVVVFHDPTLDRTTDGAGRLADRSLAELRALDAGSFFSATFRGEKIPLLDEVLEAFGRKIYIDIDLTNYTTPTDGLVVKVCELVKRHALQDYVIFSSFLACNLRQAARRMPEVPRGLLAPKGWKGIWARSFGYSFGDYAALHPYRTDVSAQQVRRVHRLKRRIHVWTVNAIDELKRLADWGVDGIFTDDPKLALQAVGRRL